MKSAKNGLKNEAKNCICCSRTAEQKRQCYSEDSVLLWIEMTDARRGNKWTRKCKEKFEHISAASQRGTVACVSLAGVTPIDVHRYSQYWEIKTLVLKHQRSSYTDALVISKAKIPEGTWHIEREAACCKNLFSEISSTALVYPSHLRSDTDMFCQSDHFALQ